MYMQSRNNGMGEIDWGGILKDAVGGYVAVKGAQTQADILKTQLAQQKAVQDASMLYQLNPQYSPQYGVPQTQQSNLVPIMLIGGAALLLFFLMKD